MKSNQFLSEDLVSDASEAQQDHEVQMARKDCFHAAEDAVALHRLLRNVSEAEGLEGWVQSKITLARDYLNKVREHLEYKLIGQESEITLTNVGDEGGMMGDKLPIAENASAGASAAGSVAAVNNPKNKKKSSQVGSLFGGSYQQRISEEEEKLDIPGTEGMTDQQRHAEIMKKYPNAKKVGKTTPGGYSTTGGNIADLVSGLRGVRKIYKQQRISEEKEKLDIRGTEGKSDEERHKAIMKKYPNAKKVGKTPGGYSTTGKGKADLVSGVRGVRKISKDSKD